PHRMSLAGRHCGRDRPHIDWSKTNSKLAMLFVLANILRVEPMVRIEGQCAGSGERRPAQKASRDGIKPITAFVQPASFVGLALMCLRMP
ncbi:MAG: hypothetical protein QNK43_12295, partial [Amphritea sp.]|nr:hypothetical protein [Amphritea sp.]